MPDAVTEPQIKRLVAEPATAEALAPFGQVLGRRPGLEMVKTDYYKGKVALGRPVDFFCDDKVELSFATLQRRPLRVRYLERHFKHSQTFIPLGGKPFVVVMAPPGEGDIPDLDKVRAFRFDGTIGFGMFAGTWHEFPFAIEDETDLVVVLSAQTTTDLKAKDADTEEAHGPDLDKKDMVARTGVVFEIAL